MNPILLAAEFACASMAYSASVSASLDVNIYNGTDNQTKVAPAIICNAMQATETYRDSGVWKIVTEIKVKEMAETPENKDIVNNGDISGVIWATFQSPDAINNLNNQSSDFIAYDIILGDDIKSQEGDAWVQALSLEIIGVLA